MILLFPGQGSQKPGMGADVAAEYSAAREVFDSVDRELSVEISTLCFSGPEEVLTSTQNAQPALLAHGAAVWEVVRDQLAPHVRAAAGHSLGEFTAYHAANALALGDAARLVRKRGELMYESGVQRPGAMAAIIGLGEAEVEAACEQASQEDGIVVPANYNSPDQLVISGEVAAVERAMVVAKAAGAKRALRLKVSGAFHSPLMKGASDGLRTALENVAMREATFPVYTNVSALPAKGAGDASRLLLEQLSAPVRWTSLVQNLALDYPGSLYVEMGPGNVLTNLVKRIIPGTQTATCGTVADVNLLLSRLA
ncbi:MAG: ACP S-malonyltransferase [Anaerolineae bacterium]|nr:ACP S-malonyltransferase [Gemmatimonadaceae bacterium]